MCHCHLVGDHAVSVLTIFTRSYIWSIANLIFQVCIGMHLARIELRLATALFFRRFPEARVSTKEGMNDDDMIMKCFFLMAPSGHRCLIEG